MGWFCVFHGQVEFVAEFGAAFEPADSADRSVRSARFRGNFLRHVQQDDEAVFDRHDTADRGRYDTYPRMMVASPKGTAAGLGFG
jgi:hypothetical protein